MFTSLKYFQISEICTVEPIIPTTPQPPAEETAKLDNGSNHGSSDENITEPQNQSSASELICLDAAEESKVDFGLTLDNFTLEDLQDDDFDPRALDNSPAPMMAPVTTPVTPVAPVLSTPVLSPPPALPPRDVKKSENNNNPFMDSSDPFGMATFTPPSAIKPQHPSNPLASLDDLDPFKNL